VHLDDRVRFAVEAEAITLSEDGDDDADARRLHGQDPRFAFIPHFERIRFPLACESQPPPRDALLAVAVVVEDGVRAVGSVAGGDRAGEVVESPLEPRFDLGADAQDLKSRLGKEFLARFHRPVVQVVAALGRGGDGGPNEGVSVHVFHDRVGGQRDPGTLTHQPQPPARHPAQRLWAV